MNKEDINDINKQLFSYRKNSQIKYSSNVIPNCKPIIGVRVPELRKMAKKIAKTDYRYFLEHCPDEYYEHQALQAYVIGYAKDDIETILKYVDKFIPKIQDWAINDAFCSTFTIAKEYRTIVWKWLKKYAAKDDEFSQRVVAGILMNHFLVDDYIDRVLKMMDKLQCPEYYTKMGVAWCIATAYTKYPEKTLAYLKNNKLDDWTFNKAIQKMRESLTVSTEEKIMLNSMKRK